MGVDFAHFFWWILTAGALGRVPHQGSGWLGLTGAGVPWFLALGAAPGSASQLGLFFIPSSRQIVWFPPSLWTGVW